jgi:hypothetical protein
MTLDPLEVGGHYAAAEKEGCSFEQVGVLDAYPAIVFPGVQVRREAVYSL